MSLISVSRGLWGRSLKPDAVISTRFSDPCSGKPFQSTNLSAVLCLVVQSYPTLCDPMDYSPSGFSILGIFFRQENWSGLPFPSPGDLPNPGIEPRSPALQADSLPSEPPGKSLPFFWMPLRGVTGLFQQSSSLLCSESSRSDWARGGRTLGILIIIWTWSTTHLHGDVLP